MNQQDVKDNMGKYAYVDFGKISYHPYEGKTFKIVKLTRAGMVLLHPIDSVGQNKPVSVAPSNVYLIY